MGSFLELSHQEEDVDEASAFFLLLFRPHSDLGSSDTHPAVYVRHKRINEAEGFFTKVMIALKNICSNVITITKLNIKIIVILMLFFFLNS